MTKISTPDIHKRIYANCKDSALWRTMLTTVREAMKYTRQSERHRNRLVCSDNFFGGGMENVVKHGMHFELLEDVRRLAVIVEEDYSAQFGPRLTVKGPVRSSMHVPHIVAFCFDRKWRLGQFKWVDDDGVEWHDTGLARAATAYKRACGWDFAPGEAGVWLCYYLLSDGCGFGKSDFRWRGNVVGFAILYDRDEDGEYETLAHIWTASVCAAQRCCSRSDRLCPRTLSGQACRRSADQRQRRIAQIGVA